MKFLFEGKSIQRAEKSTQSCPWTRARFEREALAASQVDAEEAADRYGSASDLRHAMEAALVACVAQVEEAHQKVRDRRRRSPLGGVTKNQTRPADPSSFLLSEEESTGAYELSEERTVITQMPLAEETLRMPQLVLDTGTLQASQTPEMDWVLSDEVMRTEPANNLEPPRPTRVSRLGCFWKRVSRLWQLLQA